MSGNGTKVGAVVVVWDAATERDVNCPLTM